MERIGTYQPDEEFGPPRDFFVCSARTIGDLPDEVSPTAPHFGLFIAMDARIVDDDLLRDVAGKVVAKGLVCLVAWGPGCKRVHDRVDDAGRDYNESDEKFIMTTWHHRELLKKALWYFAEASIVADGYVLTCTDWIAASIENPDWDKKIRDYLTGLIRYRTSTLNPGLDW
jgi:hypothetical protein